jgi:hypothetical protein
MYCRSLLLLLRMSTNTSAQRKYISTYPHFINLFLICFFVISTQSEYINRLFAIYTNGDLSNLSVSTNSAFKPLDASSPDAQKKTCTLFAVAVSSYLRNVQLPIASHEDFLGQLVEVSLSSTCSHQVIALAQLHGSVVNKWSNGKYHEYDVINDQLLNFPVR